MERNNQDIPLAKMISIIDKNVERLRNRLRSEAEQIIHDLPPFGQILSGNIFVESVGSIVEFDNYGNFEFLYTPSSLTLRAPSLSESEKAREIIFNAIAQQFPKQSRILNIGAGGDTIIPVCMEKYGHEVISTDLSESTINILSKEINSPVFASDLIYLNEVLPEDSIDFIIGNSTLGYVDTKKLCQVISNLSLIMKYGGIFTFDLAPHPIYFQAQEQKKYQTVINESDIDPTKLIEFVEKYGVFNGINAMAYYSYFHTHNTNIALLLLIKELFENEGLSCVASNQRLKMESGSYRFQISLRVSKTYPQILGFIENEEELTIDTDIDSIDGDRIWYRLALIDRHNGEVLAKKFGIHKSKRQDAWNVVSFINNHLSAKDLPYEIKDEVLKSISPNEIAKKIRPFLHGQSFPKPIPLPLEIIADQTLHKMVIDGTTSMSQEEVDNKIDQQYRKADHKKYIKAKKKLNKKKMQITKSKRKKARKSRKKNR